MMRSIITVLITAVFAAAAPALDVVVLTTGGELRGEVIGADDGRLRLDLLPGETGLSMQVVKEVRRESNSAWYLERIKGRDATVRTKILDSALRSGCTDRAVMAEYVASCAGAADNLLKDGLPEAAAEYCRRAAALVPDDARIAELLARAQAAQRRTAAELQALKLELERRPGNDYARFLLGECYRRLGRDGEAFSQYRAIIEGKVEFAGGIERMNELRAFIRENMQIDDAAVAPQAGAPRHGDRIVLELPGITLHCHDEAAGADLAGRLPGIRDSVAAGLGCRPADPCVVRVLPGRPEFVAATGNRFGDGYSSGDCVWTYHGAPGMIENVIPHEMAHVTVRQRMGKVPLWLDEGLAVRQEASAGAYWNLLRGKPRMPIRELLRLEQPPGSKEANDIFYASAYSLTDMLIGDGGVEKLARLAEALRASSIEQAFRDVYAVRSLSELEARWAKYQSD